MSYGNWNARSPMEVQRQNGKATDFETVARHYETVKPLQGKRKSLDVRPWGDRDRTWERVVKVSDDEYYLTCNAYNYNDNQKLVGGDAREDHRAITFKRDENVETIILHKPRWGWTSPSIYYFYAFNLPRDMNLTKHKGTTYVGLKTPTELNPYACHYYTISVGDVSFIRPHGTTEWKPLQVHREYKHSLNRKKTKAIREELKDFMDYAKSMLPFVESKYEWGTILGNEWRVQLKREDKEVYPEEWLRILTRFAGKCQRYDYQTKTYCFSEKAVMNNILREAYKQDKPFDVHEVELGQMSYDSYRSWV